MDRSLSIRPGESITLLCLGGCENENETLLKTLY